MNKFYNFLFIIFGILFYISNVPSHAESLAEITVLDENSQSLTLELTIPEPVISEIQLSGETYQAVEIAGMGYALEPGKPQLPFKGVFVAIPDGSQLQLEILDSDTEILSGTLLPPAPTFDPENPEQSEFIQGADYQTDHLQPASPVKIGLTGNIREQGVAQVQFFPVLHNPVRQTIKIYKRLKVEVSFTNLTRTGENRAPVVEYSPPFHKMLQRLLINDASSNRVLYSTNSARTVREDCPLPLGAVKVSINQTGVYAISYADFLELGLDLLVLNAELISQIHMTHDDKPVSIFIAGVEDGEFGPDDVIYFYAEAADGHYTRDNVYWLSLDPDGGARLDFKDGTPDSDRPELTKFTQTVHVETNNHYWSRMPDSTNRDHLFWAGLVAKTPDETPSLEMPVTLHHLADTSKNATIRVKLQGVTDDYATNPDHHTQILLNGVKVDDASWDGQDDFLQEVTVKQNQLLDGENIVTLVSAVDTGAIVDSLYVNWLEIEYLATTNAVEDHLIFEATGTEQYSLNVGGFTQPDLLLVLDVTDPRQILPLLGTTVSADDAGGSQIQYTDMLSGSNTYYALSLAEHVLKPAAITLDLPTVKLKSSCLQADYLIIYHDSFDIEALQNLLAERKLEDRDMQVMAVKVSDIYDEFSHGRVDPQGIKDFLTYAYENYTEPSPTYVMLVGDANQDTLNELGDGINYVPTHTFHTSLMGETASDNWFVSVSGDDSLPDMFLGRVPVRTQEELDAVVKKLTRYPQASEGKWQRTVLFVADDDQGVFKRTSERLIETYLADYEPKRVYMEDYEFDDEDEDKYRPITRDIIQSIDAGAIVTNYTGHGSLNLWAGEIIFNFENVAELNNRNKLTFVTALNCQNGWFSFYQPFRGTSDSLAEVFLKADNKGAIGMFAPSGLSYTFEHEVLANELFERLFIDKQTELGSLTTETKIAAINSGISTYILEMFTLFGDPSLHLRLE